MTGRASVRDGALALLLAAVGVLGTLGADRFSAVDRPVDALGLGIVVAAALAQALRRIAPLPVLLATAAAVSTYLVLGYPYGPVLLSFLVAAYTAARHTPPRTSLPVGALALAVLLAHVVTGGLGDGVLGLVPGSAWVVVPFAVGISVRLHRDGVERERAAAVRTQVDAERLRLAQEVHDIVGHGLAAIRMQAEVALHLMPGKPEQAGAALTAISRTAAEALDEVRAMVGSADRAPGPGLARLPALRDRMTDAGMRIAVDADPVPPDLSAATDLAAYRVVQESLTNALRHGGAGAADVRVRFAPDAVLIDVTNPVGAPPGQDGLGIPGMRKRVTALGGEFATGLDGGAFRVRARIPRRAP